MVRFYAQLLGELIKLFHYFLCEIALAGQWAHIRSVGDDERRTIVLHFFVNVNVFVDNPPAQSMETVYFGRSLVNILKALPRLFIQKLLIDAIVRMVSC